MAMKKSIYLLAVVVSALLYGCGTSQRSAYVQQCMSTTERMSGARWECLKQAEIREQQDKDRQAQQAQVESLRARCDAYGFRRNTAEHSQCMYGLQKQDIDSNFRAAQIEQENARIRQKALRDMNDALKPPAFIPPPCNGGMLNGKNNC